MATYIKRKSAKQEKRTAREFRGKTTPASGALSGAKGDVRTGVRNGSYTNENDFLIENKYTDKNFYPLKYSIWSKISNEALNDNMRTPMMQIDILGSSYVVLNSDDLESITGLKYDKLINTDKLSYRMKQEELDEYFRMSIVLGLEFKGKEKLAIMKKELFLDFRED